MKHLLNRGRSLAMACLWVIASACVLTACGGGGAGNPKDNIVGPGGSGGGTGGSSGGGGGGTVSTVPATIHGVAAVGAPLIGATITVIDAAGVTQGTAVTAMSDGAYAMTLASATPTLPLLFQARGVDMSGAPVALYSLAQSVNAVTNAVTTVNITPLTNAVVALLLGAEPTAQFQASAAGGTLPTLLASTGAFSAASTFVKTAIKNNLSDAKLTNVALVDIFGDPLFATDVSSKTGVDAAIEGVRIQFGSDPTTGHAVINLSNKLILTGVTEVTVDLVTAKSSLSGFTPTVAAGATTSTLKFTTTSTTIMPFVGDLERLRSSLNAAMASPGATGSTIAVLRWATNKPLFSTSYRYHNNYDSFLLGDMLANYGTAGQQLSSFQVLGCLDDPVITGRCTNIKVAAIVHGSAATPNSTAVFDMVMTLSSTVGWGFVGNNRQTVWNVFPATWATFDANGVLDATVSPNPSLGVQTAILADTLAFTTLQFPGGHSVNLDYCNLNAGEAMCLGTSTPTGDIIQDNNVAITTGGWLGQYDVRPGAKYWANSTGLGLTGDYNSTTLSTDLPSTASMSAYPLPDGISASTPLTHANLVAGLTVTWNTWAAAHPKMRVIEVRGVITSSVTAPMINKVITAPIATNQATLPAFSPDPGDALRYTLWMIAQDEQGRHFISKIVAPP
jgi:hypothetical protein